MKRSQDPAIEQSAIEPSATELALPAEELFSHIFQASPMAIAISVLETGRFVEVNQAFLDLTAYCRSEVIGRTSVGLGLYYTPEDRQELVEALQISGTVRGREATMRTKSGQLRRVQVFLELIDIVQQPHILTVFIDVTEREQVRGALLELRERYRLAGQASADALYDWNVITGQTQWNHGQATLFGYSGEEQREHTWWRAQLHPDDRELTVASLMDALDRREQFWSCQYRYQRADGSYAHVVDRGYFIYDEQGKPVRMIGAMIDITDRVLLAEAQTQAMLDERQRLARDLHDSVTQSLYSLTLLTEAARRMAGAGDLVRVEELLRRLGDTALLALKEMRLLVYQLRPPILEEVGLIGALQRRLDSVERRAGVQGRLLIEGSVALLRQLEEGLYFIAQEALNNALKHSRADNVTVILHATDSVVELEIVDDGQGFDLEAARDQGGLGLSGMFERARALSGQLHIASQPGHGTSIRVCVPLTGQGTADGLDDPGLGSVQGVDRDSIESSSRGLTDD